MTQASDSSSEKTLSEAIKDRRATLSFLPDLVPENDLKKILYAGRSAPSAYILHPCRFVVVREVQQRARLRRAPVNQLKLEEAPVVLGILGHVRVVALLAIGHRKGEDKRFAGRFAMQRTVFAEKWGNPIP